MEENEYDKKYELPRVQMFVIEGMDKVHEVIEKNRSRKLTKHRKRKPEIQKLYEEDVPVDMKTVMFNRKFQHM